MAISAVSGEGVQELLYRVYGMVQRHRAGLEQAGELEA